MKCIKWRAFVQTIAILGVLSLACGSASAQYTPPDDLNGDGSGSRHEDELFMFHDGNGIVHGHGKDLEEQLNPPHNTADKQDLDLPNGLSNVRVFPGGKVWAKYIFNRAVWAAINHIPNVDPPTPQNKWKSSTTNLKIYGLTRDPEAGPALISNLICTVRFDVQNRVDPVATQQDVDQEINETWIPNAKGLLAIHYHEDTDSKLAWIDFEYRNPNTQVSAGCTPPHHKQLCKDGVHSYRIIFLERAHDQIPKDYYGYKLSDNPPGIPTTYTPLIGQISNGLICDVKPYELGTAPSADVSAPAPLNEFKNKQEGGGGGDM